MIRQAHDVRFEAIDLVLQELQQAQAQDRQTQNQRFEAIERVLNEVVQGLRNPPPR